MPRLIVVTLWRAAQDDYVSDTTSFARRREDAEAYLDNPGFGGASLFRTRVRTTGDAVLNLYDERDAVTLLADRFDLQHPGAIGVDEWIPRDVSSARISGSQNPRWMNCCASSSRHRRVNAIGRIYSCRRGSILPWKPKRKSPASCIGRFYSRGAA